MTQDPTKNIEAIPRRRLRFSLFSLLVLVTLVCIVLGLYPRPTQVVVASFKIAFGAAGRPQEIEVVKRSQLQIITSPRLLENALRDPAVSNLTILANQADPAAWLQQRIRVDFPQQGEILTISMEGRGNQVAELKTLVDAVATAYREEFANWTNAQNSGSRSAHRVEQLHSAISSESGIW
jgi:hypothetical protein